jgi:hypothetical protein
LKIRLSRPLLVAAVAGALVAGGTVVLAPSALAAPSPAAATTEDGGSTPPSDDTATPTGEPTTTEPTTEPTTSAPTTEPTTSAPTTEPTTSAPTSAPTTEPTTSAPTTEPATTPPTTPPTTTPADVTAPRGWFSLNLFSLWVGQRTTLTLAGVSDDRSALQGITRVVNWGDGTTTALAWNQAAITKQYLKAGKFPITLTLTDEAGNRSVYRSGGVSVIVPGKFKLNKSAVWHGELFTIAISAVPAGTTKIIINEGDGYVYGLKGVNQTVRSLYYHRKNGALMPAGPVNLTAVFVNKNGNSAGIPVGRVTIRKDVWNPHVTITKPKKAERISSWKTIRGTATDKGSGVQYVIVVPMKANGSKVYCFTYKKTWMRLYSDSNYALCGVAVRVTKGKWSLALKGLTKGNFTVIAVAADWSDRDSNVAQVTKKITRS